MSNYDINSKPDLANHLLELHKESEKQMVKNPDSVLLEFKQELLKLGFNYQV